jgi:hypothetical protein
MPQFHDIFSILYKLSNETICNYRAFPPFIPATSNQKWILETVIHLV